MPSHNSALLLHWHLQFVICMLIPALIHFLRIAALALMLATNARLTKISISQSGIARDGCEKIVDGLAIGYGIPLAHLDLSGNPIEV